MTEVLDIRTLADLLPISDAPDWLRAACRGDANPEAWFPFPTQDYGYALSVCARCPILLQCGEFGRATGQSGVWGGRDLDRGRVQ
ncbi:WhiB family transcriptional regulator [Antrihabitans spumae]|uniref:WhiB family transcriptional regulator n=1 Tax=Antrihabitans spumae TaxID=3373370 RepID=A0ABW7JL42_9NOCA